MISLYSDLENREEGFVNLHHYLEQHEFALGGNWDYERGYFDRSLDERNQVWLRIPFEVTRGTMDGETDESDAVIKLGRPFVLKHIYNEGEDPEARLSVPGALVDQFQTPLDEDAAIEPKWVEAAQSMLDKVEQGLLQ